MGCPQCRHENRADAKLYDECGSARPRLRPGASIVAQSQRPARRPRRRSARGDIAVAIGTVLTGLAIIAAIVLNSPGWQRVFASWGEASSAVLAMGPSMATETPVLSPMTPDVTLAPGVAPALAPSPAPSWSAPAAPTRAPESPRSVPRSGAGQQQDTAQVMASLLTSHLGQDMAWRTALANADAHAIDSPEHMYWRKVATAIRDGSQRARQ